MNVLIVDDSLVFRSAIRQALEDAQGINICGAVANGQQALNELKVNPKIDLITLDLEMPVMDGMTTIQKIREFDQDVKIIVFSSVTFSSAERTLKCLDAGANDFIPKHKGGNNIQESVKVIRDELIPRIRSFSYKTEPKKVESSASESISSLASYIQNMNKIDLLCVGCSTGGPDALTKVFSAVQTVPNFPILIVQHMPPIFTDRLAQALDKKTVLSFSEAKKGDTLKPGHCYIAPGDYHMEVTSDGSLSINQDEKVCYVRPAYDVLLNSVAKNFTGQVLNLVMTGMGEDGLQGTKALLEKRPYLFVQDEISSTVWGMPGAIYKANIGARAIHLDKIGPTLEMIFKRSI